MTVPVEQTSKRILDFAPDLPRPAVLCTLVSIQGSAPQEVGARMWVSGARQEGTVGGGRFEAEVLDLARTMLADPSAPPRLKEFTLCKEMGQCCGGRVQIFFEPVRDRRTAVLFGAGHVGRAVAQVLAGSSVAPVLIDPRPEWSSPEGLPPGAKASTEDPLAFARARAWGPDDAACVFTHSHDLDFQLVVHLLSTQVGYLGLIGSEHKAKVFRARLASAPGAPPAEEVEALWDAKVRCPLGEPLPSKNPKDIAVAVGMELLRWARPAAGAR